MSHLKLRLTGDESNGTVQSTENYVKNGIRRFLLCLFLFGFFFVARSRRQERTIVIPFARTTECFCITERMKNMLKMVLTQNKIFQIMCVIIVVLCHCYLFRLLLILLVEWQTRHSIVLAFAVLTATIQI